MYCKIRIGIRKTKQEDHITFSRFLKCFVVFQNGWKYNYFSSRFSCEISRS